MNIDLHKIKMKLLCKISNPESILFHIVGFACIIWFLLRVIPKPDRIRYPCQQLSITVASTYIVFWIILWSTLFHGLGLWIKRTKHKTAAYGPAFLLALFLVFSVTTNVFADVKEDKNISIDDWEPIPNAPIGTPRGANPGRVVWVWDPDAIESNPKGYWWQKENNNQQIIEDMFSKGIQALAGVEDDSEAWDILFTHFNQVSGYGNIGYQPGEKIAIKLNLNNCWTPYWGIDNQIDANPYVVKALFKQLIENVGVSQSDITIYDAARPMMNWFYNRVYYKSYFSIPLEPEFPDINYIDSLGGASGRAKAQPSSETLHFSYDPSLVKVLPTCVADAKYIINMPQMKKHPRENGVTLSGKNMFGTWLGEIADVHPYHYSAHILGNAAPQTDLLAHKEIGGKTVLYIGDGTHGTVTDQRVIAKFNMYPFNNDWTNSLFFSQDPVAIDSVMYDFLHFEAGNSEGSQNYMHQAAEPPEGIYDPENDGTYLTESLGVHEHWNKSVDIFSSERYSGPEKNGIDFVAIGEEHAKPAVIITTPKENNLYISGSEARYLLHLRKTIVIGKLDIQAEVNIPSKECEKIEFYVDDELMFSDDSAPYSWTWKRSPGIAHNLKVMAYFDGKESLTQELEVWKIF
jgi:uncharacterized protein (DUF362 family)